ncbi:serine hydrolase domain-containing protein [Ensifer adhaerens]|uniref:serine hydrolase domain-containing protein n=1 Tax=Ensifer adhaerens TaxID=106592 RepID=UPI00080741D4|nr:serine hydrolase domain-containing protein [Ensifer adhaerens]
MHTRWLRRMAVSVAGIGIVFGYGFVWPSVTEAMFWAKPHSITETVTWFMDREGIPGALVAFGKAGEKPRLLRFGVADRETGRPMLDSMTFQIASISKLITAEAVLTLIDDGQLRLNDTLQSIFPVVAKAEDHRYSNITVRHLLQHTSGLGWSQHVDLVAGDKETFAPAEACLPVVLERLKRPLDSAPGEEAEYTDFGPCWLGLIVSKISGMPYERFVRKRVLNRLGLNRTALISEAPAEVRHHVVGMDAPRTHFNPSAGWTSTADDLYRFASRTIRDIEITTPVPGEFPEQSFGLGWWIWQRGDETDIAHTGALNGTRAVVARSSDGIVIVALFNGRERNRDLRRFVRIQHSLIDAARRAYERAQKRGRSGWKPRKLLTTADYGADVRITSAAIARFPAELV